MKFCEKCQHHPVCEIATQFERAEMLMAAHRDTTNIDIVKCSMLLPIPEEAETAQV